MRDDLAVDERCQRLLEARASDSNPEVSRLVHAAVTYFTTEDDYAPDLGSVEGFADDEIVLSAVEFAVAGFSS